MSHFLIRSVVALFNIMITLSLVAGCANQRPYAPMSDAEQPPSRRLNHHIVAKGETLYSIAWRYDLNYKALARANNINASFSIYPGQRLILAEKSPPKVKPEVKKVARATPPAKTVKKVISKPKSSSKKVIRSKKQAPVVAKSTAPNGTKKTSTWVWPTHGKLISTFQSSNGLHKGIDIQGQLAQPVISASAGKVVYSGDGLRGYGKLIIIKHSEKFLSAYAHNRRLLVKEGALVKVGQKIAEMGSTGTDTVKLHFEIRYDGKPVNPLKYLPKRR